jgi:hypothetical protein
MSGPVIGGARRRFRFSYRGSGRAQGAVTDYSAEGDAGRRGCRAPNSCLHRTLRAGGAVLGLRTATRRRRGPPPFLMPLTWHERRLPDDPPRIITVSQIATSRYVRGKPLASTPSLDRLDPPARNTCSSGNSTSRSRSPL